QGLPVVCYDRGGQTDFLATGETGHVVPLNDQQRFKEALLALYADPDTRRAHGARNRERVEQFFIDTCAARYEQVFEDVIAKRATAATRRGAVSPSPQPRDIACRARSCRNPIPEPPAPRPPVCGIAALLSDDRASREASIR